MDLGSGDMVVRMRMVVAIPLSWYVCFSADNWFCERGCDCYPFGSRYFLNGQTDLRLPKPGAHNPERANPILGLRHGVSTDQFILRHEISKRKTKRY